MNVVRSTFALPTTAIRGRLAIGESKAESSWGWVRCQRKPQTLCHVGYGCRTGAESRVSAQLLAIRNPDVLHLCGMLQEPSSLALLRVEPVDGAAFVGEHLLKVSNRKRLRRNRAGLVREAPDGVDIVVLGDRFEQLRCVATSRYSPLHPASRWCRKPGKGRR